MFRFGLPMSVNFFAIVIVDVADRFMIGGLLGADHVAPYAVAYELVQQSIGPIMNVLFLATFPIIVQVLEVEGDESARIRLRTLGCGLIGIGLPAVFGVAVLSGEISEVVFGSSFRQDAGRIMPWLAVAIFLGCFKNYFVDVVFQLRNVSKYQGYIAAFMATVNVVLNLLLLPRYGVIAAAWSTFAAFAVGLLLSWCIAKTLFPLPSVGKNFLGAAAASALMAIVLYMLPLMNGVIWLLAKIVLGIFIYSALAWILNVANCRNYLYDVIFRRIFTSKNVKIKDTTR
jgi:O-antigen/teichoic acid export membrane protein